jgi:hypothetical protein
MHSAVETAVTGFPPCRHPCGICMLRKLSCRVRWRETRPGQSLLRRLALDRVEVGVHLAEAFGLKRAASAGLAGS